MPYLIEAEWHVYVSVPHTSICSDNGFGAKPLAEPVLTYRLDQIEHISMKWGLKLDKII